MGYPKIILAMDNCFAYKRWTRPSDWMSVMRDLGIRYIEASADTELDPLYMGKDYLSDWVHDVREAEQSSSMKVANLYSGHGTYTTLGLSHTDIRVRERFVEQWFKPMIDAAVDIDAGFGFLVHGFPEFVLQSRLLYKVKLEELYGTLARINAYAKAKGCKALSLEQMYSPGMPPWTISSMEQLMARVESLSGQVFYFTEDTGHHHTKFETPTAASIQSAFLAGQKSGLWLGSDHAFEIYHEAQNRGSLTDTDVKQILDEVRTHPYLFSNRADNDCYEWLSRIGCFAPIIHLQQTDGKSSGHLPFTDENNKTGVVRGRDVLLALKHSYDRAENAEKSTCTDVYLTLELFFGSTTISRDILSDCEKSVAYWRRFIPEDGLPLDQLLERLI